MIVGGIKYRSQRFNPKSASVTAIFLFVAIIGEYTYSWVGSNLPHQIKISFLTSQSKHVLWELKRKKELPQ